MTSILFRLGDSLLTRTLTRKRVSTGTAPGQSTTRTVMQSLEMTFTLQDSSFVMNCCVEEVVESTVNGVSRSTP